MKGEEEPVNRFEQVFRNGVLGETTTDLSTLWTSGYFQQLAQNLYPDHSFLRHYGYDNLAQQLKPQHIAMEDIVFYQNYMNQNSVIVDGRLLFKTTNPRIGIRANLTTQGSGPVEFYVASTCSYGFSKRSIGTDGEIGAHFVYPTSDFMALKKEAFERNGGRESYKGYRRYPENLSRLLADSVFAQSCEKEFLVEFDTAFNTELLTFLDQNSGIVEEDVFDLARGVLTAMPTHRHRNNACYGHLVELGRLLSEDRCSEDGYLEALAEHLGQFPKQFLSNGAAWLSDSILERWHDRHIEPKAKIELSKGL